MEQDSKAKKLETSVMAHRYLYYVVAEPVIQDHIYDMKERAAREICSSDSPVHKVGSCLPDSYTDEQIQYALELQKKYV